jgi:O-antigen ligase
LLVILSSYLIILLLLKGEERILNVRLNYFVYLTIAFFALSIPSWFMVGNYQRFYITIIPTVIAFTASILIAHFLEDPLRSMRYMLGMLVLVGFFGIYQFIGDLVGIPYELTFLSERYTKVVFGFPRIHATAQEPLYFAGMLFFPIFTFFGYWLSHTNILPWLKLPATLKSIALFGFFGVLFVATISKSAIGILGILLVLMVFIWLLRYPVLRTASDLISLGLAGLVGIYLLVFFFPSINQSLTVIIDHVVDTLSGNSASIQERGIFLSVAEQLLPVHYLLGIGSGQYGVSGSHLLRFLPKQDGGGFYIVNNVYLEVLLEYGLASFLVFVTTLSSVLVQAYRRLLQAKDWIEPVNLHILVLAFTLLAYFLQWLTFSPIYIMPIFILIGLLLNLLNKRQGSTLE